MKGMDLLDSSVVGMPVLIEYEDAAYLNLDITPEDVVPPRYIFSTGVIQEQTAEYVDLQMRFSPSDNERIRGILIPKASIIHIWKLEQK